MTSSLLRLAGGAALVGSLAPAQTLLVADDPVLGPGGAFFTELNGEALVYQLGQFGALFVSDGTVAGTHALDGPDAPINPAWVTAFRGNAYFSGFLADEGTELCITDGTSAGTELLVDLLPGADGSSPTYFYAGRDLLYLSADLEGIGREVVVSDGTAGGTGLLLDVNPGAADSDPRGFFQYGDVVLFAATDADGQELWKTDGTTAGTVKVKDIQPGAASSSPVGFHEYQGLVYFSADDGVHGAELWRTDGTEAGTELVSDVSIGPLGSNPRSFTEFQGELFFTAHLGNFNYHLLKTDGTPEGHEFVWATLAGQPAGNLVVSGDRLLFMADFGTSSHRLFRSDGTTEGTEDYFEFASFWTMDSLYPVGSGGTFMTRANELATVGDPSEGAEVWVTDGTAEGTRLVLDVLPGEEYGKPEHFLRVGDTMFVSAFHDWSVWSFDLANELGEYVAETVGSGCAGSGGVVPSIAATAPPIVGQVFGVALSDAAPSAAAIFLFALGSDYLGLGPADCALVLESPFAQVLLATDPAGGLTIPLSAPPALAGVRILFQYGVADPAGVAGGVSLTPGLEVVLGV